MPNRTETKTGYDVTLEERDGQVVAIVSAVTVEEQFNGRGFAGSTTTNRQVMVVPARSLGALSAAIVDSFSYAVLDAAKFGEEMIPTATQRIGLFPVRAQPGEGPLATFYSLVEARVFAQAFKGRGFVLRHWVDKAKEDDAFRTSIIEEV